VIGSLFVIWAGFNHSNVRLRFWPLKYGIAWPNYHRVHHSIAPEHNHKNYAALFPVLDMIFGTAYFPDDDEKITTGLVHKHEARTLRQYIFGLKEKQ